MDENALLQRINFNPEMFGGKPIIRGRRFAVEHVLGMLSAGTARRPSWTAIPGSNPRTSKPASYAPEG
jgi:uncharacterized protein (DUF433 family)